MCSHVLHTHDRYWMQRVTKESHPLLATDNTYKHSAISVSVSQPVSSVLLVTSHFKLNSRLIIMVCVCGGEGGRCLVTKSTCRLFLFEQTNCLDGMETLWQLILQIPPPLNVSNQMCFKNVRGGKKGNVCSKLKIH